MAGVSEIGLSMRRYCTNDVNAILKKNGSTLVYCIDTKGVQYNACRPVHDDLKETSNSQQKIYEKAFAECNERKKEYQGQSSQKKGMNNSYKSNDLRTETKVLNPPLDESELVQHWKKEAEIRFHQCRGILPEWTGNNSRERLVGIEGKRVIRIEPNIHGIYGQIATTLLNNRQVLDAIYRRSSERLQIT